LKKKTTGLACTRGRELKSKPSTGKQVQYDKAQHYRWLRRRCEALSRWKRTLLCPCTFSFRRL